MPEGHTIHRLALDLERAFAGKPVRVSSPQGRFESALQLDGSVLTGTHAIGKHLFLDFECARVHIHLGLFGKFKRQASLSHAPRPTVRLRIESEATRWDLTGPTACEVVDAEAYAALDARLGADPLSPSARPAHTWLKVKRSKRAIGALLLDQSVFSGIGNVYRAELLFLVNVHPETPGTALEKATFDKLWKLARKLLALGVKTNRIITVQTSMKKGAANRRVSRREALYVYKQSHCRVCGVPIVKATNAARTMYHCPHCQQRSEAPLTQPGDRPRLRLG